jgi:alpha-L-fucosidase
MPSAPAARFEATLASLRQHEVPAWYHDAKLGIFVHWSLSSVPAWAPRTGPITEVLRRHWDQAIALSPYADWYENSIKVAGSPSARHHAEVWGGRPYAEFRAPFEAGLERWDPAAWSPLPAPPPPRYVVLVTKHHDGYCLWPTRVPNPQRPPPWHTRRDVVVELARAVRARGLRFGVYYSGGIDWSYAPAPLRNPLEMMASVPTSAGYREVAVAHVRELVARCAPDVLWNDIAWPTPPERLWSLFAGYYAAVPEGVVNDRWHTPGWLHRVLQWRAARAGLNALARRWVARRGIELAGPPPPHCDFLTPEYTSFSDIRRRKWEATRGMAHSFCWNRNEDPAAYLTAEELVCGFVDAVAKNGNLLLNVGPRGEDASIPDEQGGLLVALGAWLARNGEAVYGTRPWERAEGRTADGTPVRFTARGATRYAIVLGAPKRGEVRFADLRAEPGSRVRRLADDSGRPLAWRQEGADLVVTLGAPLEDAPAHAFEIAP